MVKKLFSMAALALLVGAAFFISCKGEKSSADRQRGFARARGGRFIVNGKPFRFAGANVAIMYRDDDRNRMPETLAQAAKAGIKVIRVWASGEGGPNDIGPLADFADWPRTHPFRWAPDQWNEESFVHLDKVLAEAERNGLLVNLCLVNWWRDTGGVTQYLRWAGINDAADDKFPFGIDPSKAMLFYTNEEARKLYRAHAEKLITRRNTVTGRLYRDDPTIFGWELINEGQAVTGRWAERRQWIIEMSSFIKSLDRNHMVTPGTWGYRTAAERREWLIDHSLTTVDYADVHNYPKPDADSFVDSPKAMREFVDNRAAAALSINKPLVFGEFGMGVEGFNGFSQTDWFRAFFDSNVRAGTAGAMFWILTPDEHRGYGVSYMSTRDAGVLAEVSRAAKMFTELAGADAPDNLTHANRHLVPRQFQWTRNAGDPATIPLMFVREDKTILYQFKPRMATSARFEKTGSGSGYIWGYGVGRLEYVVPERSDRRHVSKLTVRAHIQPVLPLDGDPKQINTRVTLFVNGANLGSRLIPVEPKGQPIISEWTVEGFFTRVRAMRGLPITIRFEVEADADWPYGINISNWPEGYESNDAKPIEVRLVH